MTGLSGRGVGPAEHVQRESRAEDRTEAAARAIYAAERYTAWDDESDNVRYQFKREARRVLAAADAVDRAAGRVTIDTRDEIRAIRQAKERAVEAGDDEYLAFLRDREKTLMALAALTEETPNGKL